MRIHRLSEEIANKIATDPDKCADFMSYLERYLEFLYSIFDSEHPIINNPIKSKAVGRPKKRRIGCEKENMSIAA
ncbi:6004_t:CDS:1, partial [Dentiscutata heterogama]